MYGFNAFRGFFSSWKVEYLLWLSSPQLVSSKPILINVSGLGLKIIDLEFFFWLQKYYRYIHSKIIFHIQIDIRSHLYWGRGTTTRGSWDGSSPARNWFPAPGFPYGSAGKESPCNEGDLGSIPGSGRSTGERKGYGLQDSGLENSMDCIVHGVAKSWTQMSDFHFHSSESTGP